MRYRPLLLLVSLVGLPVGPGHAQGDAALPRIELVAQGSRFQLDFGTASVGPTRNVGGTLRLGYIGAGGQPNRSLELYLSHASRHDDPYRSAPGIRTVGIALTTARHPLDHESRSLNPFVSLGAGGVFFRSMRPHPAECRPQDGCMYEGHYYGNAAEAAVNAAAGLYIPIGIRRTVIRTEVRIHAPVHPREDSGVPPVMVEFGLGLAHRR